MRLPAYTPDSFPWYRHPLVSALLAILGGTLLIVGVKSASDHDDGANTVRAGERERGVPVETRAP